MRVWYCPLFLRKSGFIPDHERHMDTTETNPDRFRDLPPLLPMVPYERYDPGVSPEEASRRFYEIMDKRTIRSRGRRSRTS